ncbi:hypothetical protein BE11_37025, partial [Sorangium cellulosum]
KLKPNAEKWLAESRAQVGAVAVTVGTAGAEVLVDGKSVGRAPLEGEVFVEPGEHRVEARLEGYVPVSQTVTAAKGEAKDVALSMVLMKNERPTAAGTTTEGGGSATGAGAGGPVAGLPPAGPVEPQPVPEKRSWVPVIALGAASAVGLGVGIGMTVASNSASEDAHAQSAAIIQAGAQCVRPEASWVEPCEQVRSDASRADTFGNVARVAFIGSGVLAIGAVTYALWPKSKRTAPIVALPMVHSGGGGLAVIGAW